MKCKFCGKFFIEQRHINRHEAICQERERQRTCSICSQKFSLKKTLDSHMRYCGNETPIATAKRVRIDAARGQLYEVETAHGGTLKTFFLQSNEAIDVVEFLSGQTETLHQLIKDMKKII